MFSLYNKLFLLANLTIDLQNVPFLLSCQIPNTREKMFITPTPYFFGVYSFLSVRPSVTARLTRLQKLFSQKL